MLAQALQFDYLDTGAMYRAVTLAALQRGVDLADAQAVLLLARQLAIELVGSRVWLDGQEISQAIRSPEVSNAIGQVADNLAVRELLSVWQRRWAAGRRVVTEGRDQGSEVFPDAPCKIFLVASSEERARRRQADLARHGVHLDWETILQQQNQRDQQDRQRPVGALRKAPDSIEFCTNHLSLETVVAELEQVVRQRLRDRGVPLATEESRPDSATGSELQANDSR